ncbi:MAG: nucleotidyltransferase [Armatimonadetes bacterium]|nr:nucleotidyltransferase [Armatimonadota bacterium]
MEKRLSIENEALYIKALTALRDAGVNYMLGGALAVYYYTNWWRNTHDVDVYVVHEDLDLAMDALARAGFHDLGEQAVGDSEWIYHAGRESIIVDVIWRFANLANYVSLDWLERAPDCRFLGIDAKVLPPEEVVWIKAFVINRHRCDWPDVMRLIKNQCDNINWDRLLDMLGEHWLLLAGLVDVFDWQNPQSVNCIPRHIREEIARRRKDYWDNPPPLAEGRERLLDPWIHQRADRYATWCDE